MRFRFAIASLLIASFLGFARPASVQGAPRMISYGYPNCVSCHVSVQGRGLLTPYGRGIDIAQSLSQVDATGALLGKLFHGDFNSGNWDGHFGNVQADVAAVGRINQDLEKSQTDPTAYALYRQIIFLGRSKQIRFNGEVGLRDVKTRDTQISPNQIAVGGDKFFLRKLMLEWRIKENQDGSGSELAIGRDYLPLGLQIDDYTTFILSMNRDGIYDFPLQAKYFAWNSKSLGGVYAYAPTFENPRRAMNTAAAFCISGIRRRSSRSASRACWDSARRRIARGRHLHAWASRPSCPSSRKWIHAPVGRRNQGRVMARKSPASSSSTTAARSGSSRASPETTATPMSRPQAITCSHSATRSAHDSAGI